MDESKKSEDDRLAQLNREAIAQFSPGMKAALDIEKEKQYGSEKELYDLVRQYIYDYTDLIEDFHYDILTLVVMESYLVDRLDFIGYLFFSGPPGSGKTRAEEVLNELCFNSLMAGRMSVATIYALLDQSNYTLVLDEIQQYLMDDKADFISLLNAGQKRGAMAYKTIRKEDGNFEPKGFNVFGLKIFASIDETTNTLGSRCIQIPMVKNMRHIPLSLDKHRAWKIRLKLEKYGDDKKSISLKETEELFNEKGFRSGRVMELFAPLVAIAPEQYRNKILEYAKQVDLDLEEDENVGIYADIYRALAIVYPNAKNGKVAIDYVANAFNMGKNEGDPDFLSNKTIGTYMTVMGAKQKTRMTGGKSARVVRKTLMDRLKFRYGRKWEPKEEQTRLEEVRQNEIAKQNQQSLGLNQLSEDSEASEAPKHMGQIATPTAGI